MEVVSINLIQPFFFGYVEGGKGQGRIIELGSKLEENFREVGTILHKGLMIDRANKNNSANRSQNVCFVELYVSLLISFQTV